MQRALTCETPHVPETPADPTIPDVLKTFDGFDVQLAEALRSESIAEILTKLVADASEDHATD